MLLTPYQSPFFSASAKWPTMQGVDRGFREVVLH
jgi:hypothetical protein